MQHQVVLVARGGSVKPGGSYMSQVLFDKGEPEQPTPADAAASATATGKPRLRVPRRDEREMRWAALDDMLEPEHQARVVWDAVRRLDLGRWLANIKAVEGGVGRDATDPRLLVALWVYATLDAIGSARE